MGEIFKLVTSQEFLDFYCHLDQITQLIPDGLDVPAKSVPHNQYHRANSHQSITHLWT